MKNKKNVFKSFMSLILGLFILSSLGINTIAETTYEFSKRSIAINENNYNKNIIKDSQSGKTYYIVNDYKEYLSKINNREIAPYMAVWDIADFAMTALSWKEFLATPSISNFAWASLDTVTLLPGLPAVSYFREGGRIFLKVDEFKKFARTSKGVNLINSSFLKEATETAAKELSKLQWIQELRTYLYPRVNKAFKLPNSGKLDPSKFRFTQDSIRKTFSDGKDVSEVIKGLKNGTIDPNNFPPIQVFELNGKYYSLDNRRLYVFKEAGIKIKYSMIDRNGVVSSADKFTTRNDGYSVIVRP